MDETALNDIAKMLTQLTPGASIQIVVRHGTERKKTIAALRLVADKMEKNEKIYSS